MSEEGGLPDLAGESPEPYEEEPEVRPPRARVLQRVPLEAREVALSLGVLLPVPLYYASVPTTDALVLLGALLASTALGLLFRRLPTPAPSIAALPAGVVWGSALFALSSDPWGLLTGLVAGTMLLLLASLPDPGDAPVPLETVATQVALSAAAAAVSFAVAISFLVVSSPLFALALLPLLGALALVVYLFGREDVVGVRPSPAGRTPPPPVGEH